MSKLRVVHVVHWPRSGIGSLLAEIMRHHRQSDVEHHVLCLEGEAGDFPALHGHAASAAYLHLRRQTPVALLTLAQRIGAIAPDLIHTHSFQPRLWSRVLSRRRIPLLATIHNAYPYFSAGDLRSRIKRTLERVALSSRPVRLACVSPGVRAALPPGWPAAEVVPNGVAVERIQALAAEPIACRVPDGHPLLVSAGRLEHQKGYDVLIDAFVRVREHWPAARLMLIGDGSQRAALAARVASRGLEHAVFFAGFQANPFPLLAQGDVYVSSSRYEGFALAVLEAMALGLPVVTTPAGGIDQIARDDECAFIATDYGADALAAGIERALADDRRRAQVAQAGRQLVGARYHLRQTADEYLAIYRSMSRR